MSKFIIPPAPSSDQVAGRSEDNMDNKKPGKVSIDWKNMKKVSIEIDKDGHEIRRETKTNNLKELAKKRAERLGL